jgi:hypothetical protein
MLFGTLFVSRFVDGDAIGVFNDEKAAFLAALDGCLETSKDTEVVETGTFAQPAIDEDFVDVFDVPGEIVAQFVAADTDA